MRTVHSYRLSVEQYAPKLNEFGYMVATWPRVAKPLGQFPMARPRKTDTPDLSKPCELTAGAIERLICPPGKSQAFLRDSKSPALRVRVTSSGAKSYVFEAKLHRQTVRLTIGDVKSWQLNSVWEGVGTDRREVVRGAREEANRLQGLVDAGRDPRQVKAETVAADVAARAAVKLAKADEERRNILVSQAWAAYIKYQQAKMKLGHIEKGKKWGVRHLADHVRMTQAGGDVKKRGRGLTKTGVLFPLLQMRVSAINKDVLREWQRTEAAERANKARQAFEAFRAFWRWCASQPDYAPMIDAAVVEDKELRDEVPSRKSKGTDSLESVQLAAWFDAVRGLSNPVISAYLQCLLLTGARREELAELKWADVDFRWGSLWVKDKVEEAGRKIPLTPYVSHLIASLPRRNEWVFSSSTAAGGRLVEPRIAHNRALSVAGLPLVTLHGLRRSFITLTEWVEMPTGVCAQITGHKPSATAERHYKQRPLDLLRKWHSAFERWVLEQAGIEFDARAEPGKLRVIS